MTDRDPEYPDLKKELAALHPNTPAGDAVMLAIADRSHADAREARGNPTARSPQTVTEGYDVGWDTADGVVGLKVNWLRDGLYLGWPGTWGRIAPELIERTLPGIKPNRFSEGWTLPLPEVHDESPIFDGESMYAEHFHVLRGDKYGDYGPPQAFYGYAVAEKHTWNAGVEPGEFIAKDTGHRIYACAHWRGLAGHSQKINARFNILEPAMIAMGCEMANAHQPSGVTVRFATPGFTIVPEVLEAMGFTLRWLRGNAGTREGWTRVVYGTRHLPELAGFRTPPLVEEVMLVSGNSLVPWVCYRKLPVHGETTPAFIRAMLTF